MKLQSVEHQGTWVVPDKLYHLAIQQSEVCRGIIFPRIDAWAYVSFATPWTWHLNEANV